MARKQFFLIVDTETSGDDRVADFGAVVCDRKGNIHAACGVLVKGVFDTVPLFSLAGTAFNNDEKRDAYNEMLNDGSRILVSVDAVNRWLAKVLGKFNPTLTAYNLSFDVGKCRNTGIDLDMFKSSFCLWYLAAERICNSKKYTSYALAHRLISPKMNIRTNAESVFGFVNGAYIIEPHTALEDARDFELPILVHIGRSRKKLGSDYAYAWQDWAIAAKVIPVHVALRQKDR